MACHCSNAASAAGESSLSRRRCTVSDRQSPEMVRTVSTAPSLAKTTEVCVGGFAAGVAGACGGRGGPYMACRVTHAVPTRPAKELSRAREGRTRRTRLHTPRVDKTRRHQTSSQRPSRPGKKQRGREIESRGARVATNGPMRGADENRRVCRAG